MKVATPLLLTMIICGGNRDKVSGATDGRTDGTGTWERVGAGRIIQPDLDTSERGTGGLACSETKKCGGNVGAVCH